MSKAVLEEDQELGVIVDSEEPEELETEEVVGEEGAEEEQIVDEEADNEPEDDEGEVVVSLGEESLTPEEETGAPDWVRELRKNHRESQKKIKELERELNESRSKKEPEVTAPLGDKPTLESFDYDSEKYEAAIATWYEKKKQHDEIAKQRELEAKQQEEAYQAKLKQYEDAKNKLNLSDFEEAEEAVLQSLDSTQQSIILSGSDNPALTIYAIGKSKARAQELASIKDLAKFAFAVSKLESQLTVTRRKAKPQPEKAITGSSKNTNGVDTTLERLRAEADKTGDRTKVIAYMRKLKAKKSS